jgi:DNA-binding transcriptional LysR family regulator
VYPDVQINLELHTSNRVMEMLQENQVDLSIIAWDRQYPLLSSAVILQNHLVLVGEPKHPLAKKRNPTLADLAHHEFLGYEPGTPTRIMIDAHFKNLGCPLDYIMESTSIATIKQLAIAGMGLALLPAFAVKLEIKLKMLKVIPVPEAAMDRPITMYWKERRVLTRPAQKFVEFVRGWGKRNGEKTDDNRVGTKTAAEG